MVGGAGVAEARVRFRPATEADVLGFYNKPFAASMRGIAAEIDGETLGIMGVLHGNPLQAFSSMLPAMGDHPMAIKRAIRLFQNIAAKYSTPIYAKASTEYANSRRVLRLAGFEPFDEEKRLYRWTPRH